MVLSSSVHSERKLLVINTVMSKFPLILMLCFFDSLKELHLLGSGSMGMTWQLHNSLAWEHVRCAWSSPASSDRLYSHMKFCFS